MIDVTKAMSVVENTVRHMHLDGVPSNELFNFQVTLQGTFSKQLCEELESNGYALNISEECITAVKTIVLIALEEEFRYIVDYTITHNCQLTDYLF